MVQARRVSETDGSRSAVEVNQPSEITTAAVPYAPFDDYWLATDFGLTRHSTHMYRPGDPTAFREWTLRFHNEVVAKVGCASAV